MVELDGQYLGYMMAFKLVATTAAIIKSKISAEVELISNRVPLITCDPPPGPLPIAFIAYISYFAPLSCSCHHFDPP